MTTEVVLNSLTSTVEVSDRPLAVLLTHGTSLSLGHCVGLTLVNPRDTLQSARYPHALDKLSVFFEHCALYHRGRSTVS